MGYLGKPFRVTYEAKNFTPGLTDIVAAVLKPNGTVAGLFPMLPIPSIFFAGKYYFDLITSPSDPEGEYICSVISPTENHTSTLRVPLYPWQDFTPQIAALTQIVSDLSTEVTDLQSTVNVLQDETTNIHAEVVALTELVDNLTNVSYSIISATIPAFIRGAVSDKVFMKIKVYDTTKIKGIIEAIPPIKGIVLDKEVIQ